MFTTKVTPPVCIFVSNYIIAISINRVKFNMILANHWRYTLQSKFIVCLISLRSRGAWIVYCRLNANRVLVFFGRTSLTFTTYSKTIAPYGNVFVQRPIYCISRQYYNRKFANVFSNTWFSDGSKYHKKAIKHLHVYSC